MDARMKRKYARGTYEKEEGVCVRKAKNRTTYSVLVFENRFSYVSTVVFSDEI